jgi:hypothetical protein
MIPASIRPPAQDPAIGSIRAAQCPIPPAAALRRPRSSWSTRQPPRAARPDQNPAQPRLHAARRARRRPPCSQPPPLLRSRAVLARSHARSPHPRLAHQRRSRFRRGLVDSTAGSSSTAATANTLCSSSAPRPIQLALKFIGWKSGVWSPRIRNCAPGGPPVNPCQCPQGRDKPTPLAVKQ